jgi:hypothetical protein
MRRKPPALTIERLKRIKYLADDLSRELLRSGAGATPAARAMAEQIRNDAENTVRALTGPKP